MGAYLARLVVIGVAIGALACSDAADAEGGDPAAPSQGGSAGSASSDAVASADDPASVGARPTIAANCGGIERWDRDGDGISDRVEDNNALAPLDCTEDPTEAKGQAWEGGLAGLNLPDKGAGYVHHPGTDPVDSDDWGTLELLTCIESVGRQWEPRGYRMNINDMSKKGGGRFRPHRSHQNGLDVDIRYVRKDGQAGPLDVRRTPGSYDRARSRDLVRSILATCNVELILIDVEAAKLGIDDARVRHANGHSNHFHLRLRPRGAPRAAPAPRTRNVPEPTPRSPREDVATVAARRSPAQANVLEIVSPAGQASYTSRADAISSVQVAPGERYVAALETVEGTVVEGDYQVLPRTALVVLDATANEVRRVEDVHRFVFSPDGARIAFVSGTYHEGDLGFAPSGAGILPLPGGAVVPIEIEPIDLSWARPDGRDTVFFEAAREGADGAPEIVAYDVASATLSASGLRGVDVSPDGTYVLMGTARTLDLGECEAADASAGCFKLFERQGGGERELRFRGGIPLEVSWSRGGGHRLVVVSDTPEETSGTRSADEAIPATQVYDVDAGELIGAASERALLRESAEGWVGSGAEVVVAGPGTRAADGPKLEKLVLP